MTRNGLAISFAIGLLALNSCASLPLAGRTGETDAAYDARERATMEASDRCGPQFIQSKLPEGFVGTAGKIVDGPFRPVCARHDACYRLGEKSQGWCDARMKNEMQDVCESAEEAATYSVPAIGHSLCRFHASVFYAAINNSYGAYAYGGLPGGEIVNVSARQIEDAVSDDEFEVCAAVKNTTALIQEYDVELHDAAGKRIDREPDLTETNVGVGETKRFVWAQIIRRAGASRI